MGLSSRRIWIFFIIILTHVCFKLFYKLISGRGQIPFACILNKPAPNMHNFWPAIDSASTPLPIITETTRWLDPNWVSFVGEVEPCSHPLVAACSHCNLIFVSDGLHRPNQPGQQFLDINWRPYYKLSMCIGMIFWYIFWICIGHNKSAFNKLT